MACESCRSQARLLVRAAARASRAPVPATTPKRYLATLSGNGKSSSSSSSSVKPQLSNTQARQFSRTSPRNLLDGVRSTASSPYLVVGATERLYKVCGEAADYHIPEEAHKNDTVTKLEDGEEVGNSTGKRQVWHKLFKLPPTFSTWSHVTMLHLYLLNARIRCFDRDTYANWRQQLIDHFFFEAERKMHIDHNITSGALRQRYLKDIFVQWRGVLVAYDEGLVKGDAILASAVWRNLFKGSPDVDPRALAAIVGWMRSSLKALETTSDSAFPARAQGILELPVESFWSGLEKGAKTQAEGSRPREPKGSGAKKGPSAEPRAAKS